MIGLGNYLRPIRNKPLLICLDSTISQLELEKLSGSIAVLSINKWMSKVVRRLMNIKGPIRKGPLGGI